MRIRADLDAGPAPGGGTRPESREHGTQGRRARRSGKDAVGDRARIPAARALAILEHGVPHSVALETFAPPEPTATNDRKGRILVVDDDTDVLTAARLLLKAPGRGRADGFRSRAVETIRLRSEGLLRFVDNYRRMARLPVPALRTVKVADLVKRVEQPMRPVLEHACAPSRARGRRFVSSLDALELRSGAKRKV